MQIAIAQTRSIKGDIVANTKSHLALVYLAVAMHADAVFFPELSLTGYEPELAKHLTTTQDDNKLDVFQKVSDANRITIGVGLPTPSVTGIRISMIIFQPNAPRLTYSKQQLHADEFPYFEQGDQEVVLTISGVKVAPAICFESLQPDNIEQAVQLGADVYLASVAKPQGGLNKASSYFPEVAKQYQIPILMANCVGYCDNFLSVGQSAVWTSNGVLAAQLDDQREGLIIFDTTTGAAVPFYL